MYVLNGTSAHELGLGDRAGIRNREIGFILQSFNLIGDLTVLENVELPFTYRGMESAERSLRVRAALERVGIDPSKSTLDPKRIDAVLAPTGGLKSGVYKITIGREAKMHGGAMGSTVGVNAWAAFAGSDESAIVDVALRCSSPSSRACSRRFARQRSTSSPSISTGPARNHASSSCTSRASDARTIWPGVSSPRWIRNADRCRGAGFRWTGIRDGRRIRALGIWQPPR